MADLTPGDRLVWAYIAGRTTAERDRHDLLAALTAKDEEMGHLRFLLRECRPFVAAHEGDPQHLVVSIDAAVPEARALLARHETREGP